jgi:hypothetical protein
LYVEATARDKIYQVFHLSFSVFPLTVVVVVAAVVVMLLAVVLVVIAVVVSNSKYTVYIVCSRPHYKCR